MSQSLSTQFVATWRLTRLAVRRDRVKLPVWLLALSLLTAFQATSVATLYADSDERVKLAISSAKSAVSLIFNGLVSGTNLGATTMTQIFIPIAVGAAIMNILLVVRHTRQSEETGRSELIGSAVVGRYAGLAAALVVAVAANVGLAAMTAAGLATSGLDAAGSILAGCAIAGIGIVFAAVAAIAAQVAETSRAANGLALIALAVLFLLRALGDVAGRVTDAGTSVVSAWPSWLSPIGWGQQARPYDENQWWVLIPLIVAATALVGVACLLSSHRDVGTGMMPVRGGPVSAPRSLLSPLGLAWRLQRGTLYGWLVGMTILGAALGGVGDEVDDLIGGSEGTEDLITKLGGGAPELVDAYFAATLTMMGIAVAGYAVSALLRMRSEETGGALELLLSTSVRQSCWVLGHALVVSVGVVTILVGMGLSMALCYGLVTGDMTEHFGELMLASVVSIPAALLVASCVALVFGIAPRVTAAVSWAAFTVCLVITKLGDALDLPQALVRLSPFSHVPAVPAEEFTAAPLVILAAAAALITTVGVLAFRHRDLKI